MTETRCSNSRRWRPTTPRRSRPTGRRPTSYARALRFSEGMPSDEVARPAQAPGGGVLSRPIRPTMRSALSGRPPPSIASRAMRDNRARRSRAWRRSSGAPAAGLKHVRSRTRRSTCSSPSLPGRSSSTPTRRCPFSPIPGRTASVRSEWATRAQELAVAYGRSRRGWRTRSSPSAGASIDADPVRGHGDAAAGARGRRAERARGDRGRVVPHARRDRGRARVLPCPRRRADRAVPRRRALPRRAERGPLDGRDELRAASCSDDAPSRRSPRRCLWRCSPACARAGATPTSRP